MAASPTSPYPPGEERANILTHGIGAAVALVAGIAMVTMSIVRGGDAWQWASAIVFSASMLMLYLASTAYHRAVDPVRRCLLYTSRCV